MKFKLNGLEKFVMKNHQAMKVITIVLYFISLIICNYHFQIGFTMFLIILVALLYVMALPVLKNHQLVKINDVHMNPVEMMNGANLMLETLKPKDINNVCTYCLLRIVALINMGEFDMAENEIRLFWQNIDLNKVNDTAITDTHILMANITLEKGDMKSFDEQMNLVYEYRKKAQSFALFKNPIDYNIESVKLSAEAMTATPGRNENDYETKVLTHLRTNPLNNKPRKKDAQPIFVFSAYSKLFEFFKRTGNVQKSTYYAQQLVSSGNEQFIDYRRAKEYLENANRSN